MIKAYLRVRTDFCGADFFDDFTVEVGFFKDFVTGISLLSVTLGLSTMLCNSRVKMRAE